MEGRLIATRQTEAGFPQETEIIDIKTTPFSHQRSHSFPDTYVRISGRMFWNVDLVQRHSTTLTTTTITTQATAATVESIDHFGLEHWNTLESHKMYNTHSSKCCTAAALFKYNRNTSQQTSCTISRHVTGATVENKTPARARASSCSWSQITLPELFNSANKRSRAAVGFSSESYTCRLTASSLQRLSDTLTSQECLMLSHGSLCVLHCCTREIDFDHIMLRTLLVVI